MRPLNRLALSCLLALALPVAASAADGPQSVASPATRTLFGPTVINRPGLYTVGAELAVGSGKTAVRVVADNVTLDLGGHTLSGPGGPGSVGVEIAGADNVRVRNGALSGFGVGVLISGSRNAHVEGVQISGRDLGGSPPNVEVGILLIDSRGIVVTDNLITDTFLGIFVRGEGSGGNRIAGNTLVGGDHGELGICYNPAPGATSGGPSGDLVYNNLVSRFNRGISLSADSRSNVVRENTLATYGAATEEATAGANELLDNISTHLVP